MWLARRNNRPAAFAGGGGRMQHEGSLTLGRGCALHVLRVDGQTVAVTTDTTGLRSIAILSEPFEAVLAESTDGPADLETETTRAA
jgi:hypothetical protein